MPRDYRIYRLVDCRRDARSISQRILGLLRPVDAYDNAALPGRGV
jgi:hypothetical protein